MIHLHHYQWQPRLLIGAHIAATLLLFSWVSPPTAHLWDQLDSNLFSWLNATLVDHPGRQLFWALLCARLLDLPVAGFLALLCLSYCFRGPKGERAERLARLAYMAIALSTSVYLFHIVLFDGFHYFRLSPSFALDAEVWLSQTVDIGLSIRDKSRHSFPSDHGVQLYYWTAFFWRFGGKRLGIPALSLTLILSVPRLVSGSHWITDGVVGSLFLVLIAWSWAVGTPLMERAVSWLTPFFEWFLAKCYALSSAAKGVATRPSSTLPK